MSESRHLRVLKADPAMEPEDRLLQSVRRVRRDLARLLRALQCSGRGLSHLPDPITTRLAHVDSVTARFLLHPPGEPDVDEVEAATNAMDAIGRWIVDQLARDELAELRAHELKVRIVDDELTQPLVCACWAGHEPSGAQDGMGALESQRLRAGLASLDDITLASLCLRLGVRVEPPPWPTTAQVGISQVRVQAEQCVLSTLADGHLLAILIATLPGEAHRLLAALVRGKLDDITLRRLATPTSRALTEPLPLQVVGADTPAAHLRSCALAFDAGGDGRLWVPVELQRQIDGVLRAFGI
ncbi:MAG: hypothetical protein B7733_25475 [Myxococcales bacterium FL481]|nr:MAG: hypothetical protein B7733_25475 [Myxococcales bacterium FL481]